MDKDEIEGVGQTRLGAAEKAVGNVLDGERLEGDGILNKLAGGVQQGYGKAKDTVSDIVDETPAAVGEMANRSRELLHDANAAIRRKLGDHGPLYVLAGAIGFLGLALFAVARANEAVTPAKKRNAPRARPHAAAAKGD